MNWLTMEPQQLQFCPVSRWNQYWGIAVFRCDGCFKSHIAEIKRFFIFVRRSGTSLASKCKHGSSLDISFLSVTHIL